MTSRTIQDSDGAVLPTWVFLRGEAIAGNDGSQLANLPADVEIVHIAAEGGAVYYAINSLIAGTNAPGYIPSDQRVIIGTLRDFTSLAIYAATGTTVHIEYYKENQGE